MTPLDITEVLSEAATLTKRLRELQGTTDDIPVADLLRKHGGKTGESSPTTLPATTTAPPAQAADTDAAVAALEKLSRNRGRISRNEQGEIVGFRLSSIGPIFSSNKKDLTDAGLVHLKGLTNLKKLHLSITDFPAEKGLQITDAELVHLKGLTNLKELDLSGGLNALLLQLGRGGQKITDAGLVHLKRLTNLEKLDLSGCQVTRTGVAELKKALPKCRYILFISHN